MSDFDDDEIEPVLVKRAVYDAARKFDAEVVAAGKGHSFNVASDKADECKAAGDQQGAAYWSAIFQYLMDAEVATAGAETIILEEGDTYDFEENKVIRAGTNPPHSGRDFQ